MREGPGAVVLNTFEEDVALAKSLGPPKCPKCCGDVALTDTGAVCLRGDGLFITKDCMPRPNSFLSAHIKAAFPELVSQSPADLAAVKARSLDVPGKVPSNRIPKKRPIRPLDEQQDLFAREEIGT